MGCGRSRSVPTMVLVPDRLDDPNEESIRAEAARNVERNKEKARRRREAVNRMVASIESDEAAVEAVRLQCLPELIRCGLISHPDDKFFGFVNGDPSRRVGDDVAWPPPRVPTQERPDWGSAAESNKRARLRYVRQVYENAVTRFGEHQLLLGGWRPHLHCLIRDATIRREVETVFVLWASRRGECLSLLPRDVLFLVLTFLCQPRRN